MMTMNEKFSAEFKKWKIQNLFNFNLFNEFQLKNFLSFLFEKPPQPVEPWSNVLDAFEHSNICVQPKKLLPNELPQSEDCLTLNVYVPGTAVLSHDIK